MSNTTNTGSSANTRPRQYITPNKPRHPILMVPFTGILVILLAMLVDGASVTILSWIPYIDLSEWKYQFLLLPLSVFSSMKILRTTRGAIPLKHEALLRLFGKRTKVHFHEGAYWIPKLIYDFIVVDIREQLADLSPLSVSVKKEIGGGSNSGNEARVELDIDTSIDFRINNIYKFLNVDDFRGKLKSSAQKEARKYAANKGELDILGDTGGTNGFAEKVLEGLADEEADWGIEIIRVNMTDVDYSDDELKKAQSAVSLAQMKGKAGVTAAELLRDSAEAIKGGSDVGDEEALDMALILQGDMTAHKQKFSGGSTLTEAASIFNRQR